MPNSRMPTTVLALALAVVGTVATLARDAGPPDARRYPTAAEVVAAVPGCLPQSVWGKYAGVAYDRCSLDGRTVSVWMDGQPAESGPALEGPGWTVTAAPAALAEARQRLGGDLR